MKITTPILQLIEEFLRECSVSEVSRINYRTTLKLFVHWQVTTSRDVRNVRRSDIIQYKDWLIAEGKSSLTIDNYLASIRQFFKWLEEKDYHENIAIGVKSPRKNRLFRRKYLEPGQINQMLMAVDTSTQLGKRDYALLKLMVFTGMRCIEVVRANINDIETTPDRFLLSIQRKGQIEKGDVIRLPNTAMEAIHDYLLTRQHKQTDPLFVSHGHNKPNSRITTQWINQLVKRYMKRGGLTGRKYTAHSLRHTFACWALNNGEDIYTVKAMLGHKNMGTTEIYTAMLEDKMRRDNTVGSNMEKQITA